MKLSDFVEKGDRWYLRLPGGTSLIHAAILSRTSMTVSFKRVDENFSLESRYKISDIEFVEKTNHQADEAST